MSKTTNETINKSAEDNSNINFTLKLVFLFIIWIIGWTFRKKRKASPKVIGMSNAFSGGIFWAIGLFHLLPESDELIKEVYKNGAKNLMSILPMAYFLCFGVYALILFVEKVLFNAHSIIKQDHDLCRYNHVKDSDDLQQVHNSELHDHLNKGLCCNVIKEDHQYLPDLEKAQLQDDEEVKDFAEEAIKDIISTRGQFISFLYMRNSMFNNTLENRDENHHRNSIMLEKVKKSLHKEKAQATNEIGGNIINIVNIDCSKTEDSQIDKTPLVSHTSISPVTPFVLMLALSFHAVFESLALGIQQKTYDTVFLGVAIICHKWAESFSLVIQLYFNNSIGDCVY